VATSSSPQTEIDHSTTNANARMKFMQKCLKYRWVPVFSHGSGCSLNRGCVGDIYRNHRCASANPPISRFAASNPSTPRASKPTRAPCHPNSLAVARPPACRCAGNHHNLALHHNSSRPRRRLHVTLEMLFSGGVYAQGTKKIHEVRTWITACGKQVRHLLPHVRNYQATFSALTAIVPRKLPAG